MTIEFLNKLQKFLEMCNEYFLRLFAKIFAFSLPSLSFFTISISVSAYAFSFTDSLISDASLSVYRMSSSSCDDRY